MENARGGGSECDAIVESGGDEPESGDAWGQGGLCGEDRVKGGGDGGEGAGRAGGVGVWEFGCENWEGRVDAGVFHGEVGV